MSTENEDFTVALTDLIRASARFALAANVVYKTEHFQSAAAYAELWQAGKAHPEIRVTVANLHTVEFGFHTDSGFQKILTCDAATENSPKWLQ